MFGLNRDKVSADYLCEFISEYGAVSNAQISRILANIDYERRKKGSLFKAISTVGTALYDEDAKVFFNDQYIPPNSQRQFAMDRALWVLIDFLGRIDMHFRVSSDYAPSLICMSIEKRFYEIAYAASGQEEYLDNQLRAARLEMIYKAESEYLSKVLDKDDKIYLEGAKYIIILDDVQQARHIKSNHTAYFCTLNAECFPTFYKPDEVLSTQVGDKG